MNAKGIIPLATLTVLLMALSVIHARAQSMPDQRSTESGSSGPRYIKIAWVIMQAKQFSKNLPDYPQAARDKAIQGHVRLSIHVGKDGKVEEAKVLSGDPALGNPAADEVRRWEFQPTLLNRQPVDVPAELDLEFSLRKGKAQVRCSNADPRQRGR